VSQASALYLGGVMHQRLRPRRHRLEQRAFWLLLDLSELDGVDRRLRLFSRNRWNLFAFFDTATAHFYARERREVMDSWPRVFEIDEWSIFKVQGNLWEIRPDMIREILFADGTRQVFSDGYRPA